MSSAVAKIERSSIVAVQFTKSKELFLTLKLNVLSKSFNENNILFYAADGLKIEFFDFHDFMASVWQSCSSTWNNNFSLLLSSIVLLTSRKSKWERKGTA